MNIEKNARGDVLFTADPDERKEIARLRKMPYTKVAMEAEFIRDGLWGTVFKQVRPEEVGAPTSAPLISDGEHVYGFMDYQIRSFLEELENGNTVLFRRG